MKVRLLAPDSVIPNLAIMKISTYHKNKGDDVDWFDPLIDFADTDAPVITKLDVDFRNFGYQLFIIDSGADHAGMTDEYAAVPGELKQLSALFGKKVLREVPEEEFFARLPELRHQVPDRAILRAIHFFEENKRVDFQKSTLREGNLEDYFAAVKASGKSSFCYLQNVYTTKNVAEQGLSLALSLCDNLLSDRLAAFRVHGGGFAGTIQAWVPADAVDTFITTMDAVFGRGAAVDLRVRPVGAARIL